MIVGFFFHMVVLPPKVYLEIGADNNDMATVTITLGGTGGGNRLWDIKVSQIECSNPLM